MLLATFMMKLNFTEFSLNELVDDTQLYFSSTVPSEEVEIKTYYDKEYRIKSDRSRIKQLLTNLMTNAAKHTDAGEITIGIRGKNDTIEIFVSDSGIGIAEGHEDKLFERFFRIENPGRVVPGTGLGLAICKAIVTSLSGKIWFASEIGIGSTFTFALPQK